MKCAGLVAVLVGIVSWIGAPLPDSAEAATPSKTAVTGHSAANPRGKALRPAPARSGVRGPKSVSRSGLKSSAKESRAAQAARASLRKSRVMSKTPRGAHATRASAAMAGGGSAAKAVPASLHHSAADAGGTPSIGEAIGLHRVPDPLALRSAVALVVDAAQRRDPLREEFAMRSCRSRPSPR